MAIDFWYEFASTYSYPAAMRIDRLAAAAGIDVRWRPFLLGPMLAQQNLTDSPFNVFPVKGRYMWRDLERICAAEGLPFRRPSQFPRRTLLPARVATVAANEGWCPEFSRAVYDANFARDRDIGDPAVIADILAGLGRDPAAVLAAAQAQPIKDQLKAAVDEAMGLGVFGAPSVTAAGELFWGNDRLEQALAWAKRA
jgi:2-hydroxychromene-2-carboxylate isomerase